MLEPIVKSDFLQNFLFSPFGWASGNVGLPINPVDFYGINNKIPGTVVDNPNDFFYADGATRTFDEMFTHSATTLMTTVDSDGVLKWCPHNSLVNTDMTQWSRPGWTVTENGVVETGDTEYLYTSNSISGGRMGIVGPSEGICRFEVEVRAGSVNLVTITGAFGVQLDGGVFNLTAGSVSSQGGSAHIASTIELLPSGRYLCRVDYDASLLSDPAIGFNMSYAPGETFYASRPRATRTDLGGMQNNPDTGDSYVPNDTGSARFLPRRHHHIWDGTAWVDEGCLIEPEARTNLLLNSDTLSTQSATVTAVPHTIHFTGTGTVTLSGASTAGPLVGTGTGESNRVSLTFTPTAGSLTLTVSGTVSRAQLEAGSTPSSYIPTNGATATRAAESIEQKSHVDGIMPSGATGGLAINFLGTLTYFGGETQSDFIEHSNFTGTDFHRVGIDTRPARTGSITAKQRRNGGAFGVDLFTEESSATDYLPGVNIPTNIASSYGTRLAVSVDGVSDSMAASALSTNLDGEALVIGKPGGQVSALTNKLLRVWDQELTDAELEEVTTPPPPSMPEAMADWYSAGSTASSTEYTAVGTHNVRLVFGVTTPDGIAYSSPWHGDTAVARFNIDANTVTNPDYGLDFLESAAFADMQGGQYGAACYASDGKIYFAPWAEDEFLVIDPVAETAIKTDFGQPLGAYSTGPPTGLYAHSYGLVEGPNQKLYSIPYTLNRPPVIIDLVTQTASAAPYANIKTGGVSDLFELWNGGALAPNGKIYCAPYQRADEVLVIDTADDTATLETFGLGLTGDYQFGAPTLGPDGKIYMAPYSKNACLIIDPATETAVLEDWGLDLSGGFKYYSSTVGPDGKIYCPPSFTANGWLVIDPIAGTASFEDLGTPSGINYVSMLGDGRLVAFDGSDTSGGFGGSSAPSAKYWIIDVTGAAGPATENFASDAFTIWHPR